MSADSRIFLAYAPRGAGLRCALAYRASNRDAFGWFSGPGDGVLASAYFVLEDIYTTRPATYVAVSEGDLHSTWIRDEARCHALAQMQEAFRREWLFYRSDPGAQEQLAAYAGAELAMGEFGIRFDRLNKLSKLQPNWIYYSRDFERGVLRHLAKRWPLDYRGEEP